MLSTVAFPRRQSISFFLRKSFTASLSRPQKKKTFKNSKKRFTILLSVYIIIKHFMQITLAPAGAISPKGGIYEQVSAFIHHR